MAEVSQRGTKRKRHETNEEDVTVKIAGKLHHDVKGVKKAAKKAKAFEMQKLLKKLKGLRGKDAHSKEISGFEAQLEALKCTDSDLVANTALTTKLKKDRILSENTSVQAAISAQLSANLLVSAETGTPSSKVQSRLLSSKVLATEITAVVDDLKFTLQARTKGPVQIIDNTGEPHDIDEPPERRKKTKVAPVPDESSSDNDGNGGADGSKDEGSSDSSAADEVDDDADDGWESGSVLSGHGLANDEETFPGSDSGSEEDSDHEHRNFASQPVRKGPSAKTGASAVESTFLPTLSVGFVRGDSDSEWSDSEAKTADVRKNRRGQRARRAIWEKKYGKNANHTKKQREAMEASGRGQRSGAARKSREEYPQDKRPSTRGGRSKPEVTPQYHQQADAGWVQRNKLGSSSSTNPVTALSASGPQQPQRREERGLHPSWEAKRRQRERQSVGILPAQGTKIKF